MIGVAHRKQKGVSSSLVHCPWPGLRWGKGGPGTASEPEGEHQSTQGLETEEAENTIALWVCQQLENCKEPPYTATLAAVELGVGGYATEMSFHRALWQGQRHGRSGFDHRFPSWGLRGCSGFTHLCGFKREDFSSMQIIIFPGLGEGESQGYFP